jgi:hypothetical protein
VQVDRLVPIVMVLAMLALALSMAAPALQDRIA